jgi:hypothetical protein
MSDLSRQGFFHRFKIKTPSHGVDGRQTHLDLSSQLGPSAAQKSHRTRFRKGNEKSGIRRIDHNSNEFLPDTAVHQLSARHINSLAFGFRRRTFTLRATQSQGLNINTGRMVARMALK